MPAKRLTKQERRKQIVGEAYRAFSMYGFEEVTVKDIARACGTDPALIYAHFKTKEDLYKETALHFTRELENKWLEEIQNASTGLESLRNFNVNRFKEIYSTPENARAIFNIALASQYGDKLRKIVTTEASSGLDRIASVVVNAQKEGALRADLDPIAVATWMLGYFFFIFLIVREGAQERYPLDKAVKYFDEFATLLVPVNKTAKAKRNIKEKARTAGKG